jgi:GntR family transcriptional regulator of arabinose operon
MPRTRLKQTEARDKILARIQTGIYRPAQRLPSERELAQELGLHHVTVRHGLQELVEAGFIIKRPSVGNFVAEIRSNELAKRIAIVLPRWLLDGVHAHPVTGLLIQGIFGELDQRDFAISLIAHGGPERLWLEAGETLLARGIQGAILWPYTQTPRDQLHKLMESGVKLVMLNPPAAWRDLRISSITVDYLPALREAMDRLLHLGHRRIVLIAYNNPSMDWRPTLEAYTRQTGLNRWQDLMHLVPERIEGQITQGNDPEQALIQLMDRRPAPTAIIAQDEYMAHDLFRACYRRDIHVPQDLSIVALNDTMPDVHVVPLSAPDTVGLTIQMAREAAIQLKYLISHNGAREIDRLLPNPIQWKQSTGPCPPDRSPGPRKTPADALPEVILQLQRLQEQLSRPPDTSPQTRP